MNKDKHGAVVGRPRKYPSKPKRINILMSWDFYFKIMDHINTKDPKKQGLTHFVHRSIETQLMLEKSGVIKDI
jgi:hypothetical protein